MTRPWSVAAEAGTAASVAAATTRRPLRNARPERLAGRLGCALDRSSTSCLRRGPADDPRQDAAWCDYTPTGPERDTPPGTTDGHGGGSGVGAARRVATEELSADELRALRRLIDASFASFDDDDWAHALGGIHVILEEAGGPVSHAAVVERMLGVDGRMLRTGYVEAVCTALAHRGRGHATTVMREVGDVIQGSYELGGLGTGIHGFYARFGWERWEGPTSVRTVSGREPTPKNDGGIMILRTAATERLDLRAGLSCEWRAGSVW